MRGLSHARHIGQEQRLIAAPASATLMPAHDHAAWQGAYQRVDHGELEHPAQQPYGAAARAKTDRGRAVMRVHRHEVI